MSKLISYTNHWIDVLYNIDILTESLIKNHKVKKITI